jgi:hypothetical protein
MAAPWFDDFLGWTSGALDQAGVLIEKYGKVSDAWESLESSPAKKPAEPVEGLINPPPPATGFLGAYAPNPSGGGFSPLVLGAAALGLFLILRRK